MIVCFFIFLIKKLLGDDFIMMAMFFAQRVILDKTKFKDVPASLQQGVKEILVDSGLEFLIGE